jgi:GT2 family glycosyltransferase
VLSYDISRNHQYSNRAVCENTTLLSKELSPPDGVASQVGRVYVIVLNWNGWRDTIECLESVLRLDYPDCKVVVCDNASSDGSLDQIRRWAQGELKAEARNPVVAPLTSPPIPKPLSCAQVDPVAAKNEGVPDAGLLLMQTKANLGFAGGNNVALRYALNRGDCDFAWLLNNDTVVRPDALSHLVRRMRERPDAGICGSTLLYYDDPSKVQAFGGSVYNKWVTRGGHIGKLANAERLPEAEEVERQMAYIVGASMLVRKSFLEQVGLMEERYFLYFEELDWAERARGRFQLAYSPRSIVYHKEGGTIGTHRDSSRRSALAEFYASRSRILFTRRHHPLALPSALAAVGLIAVHRSLNLRWRNLQALVRGALQGLKA